MQPYLDALNTYLAGNEGFGNGKPLYKSLRRPMVAPTGLRPFRATDGRPYGVASISGDRWSPLPVRKTEIIFLFYYLSDRRYNPVTHCRISPG